MFTKIEKELRIPNEIKENMYEGRDKGFVMYGSKENAKWGLRKLSIVLIIEQQGKNYDVVLLLGHEALKILGTNTLQAFGEADDVVEDLNGSISKYFSELAASRGLKYEY